MIIIILEPSVLANINNLIQWNIIYSLLLLMIIAEGMKSSGIINLIVIRFVSGIRDNLSEAIMFLLATSLIATVLMNDTSLFLVIPMALTLSKISKIPKEKLVILTIIAVNIGSSLTPLGNPQNLIIWHHYHLRFLEFVLSILPFIVISEMLLLLYALFLLRSDRIQLENDDMLLPNIYLDKKLGAISTALLASFLIIGTKYSLILLIIALTSIFILKREIVKAIDPFLIVIFILMLFDFNSTALIITKIINLRNLGPHLTFFLAIIISQLISNVPATIILINLTTHWRALAIGVNLAGVGFIIGSMANIIGLRLADIDYKTYHIIAIPYFLSLLVITSIIIVLT